MEILQAANIDLFQVLDTNQYEKIIELVGTKGQTYQFSSSTMEDLFIACYYNQKNNSRKYGSSSCKLFLGSIQIVNEANEKEWIPIFEKPIRLIADPYKNGFWSIKTIGDLQISKGLKPLLKRDHIINMNPCLAKFQDLQSKTAQETLKKLMDKDFMHLELSPTPLPSIETLFAEECDDFYLTAILANNAEQFDPQREQDELGKILEDYHRSPKHHKVRNDIEVSYPFMDSEQKSNANLLEDRKLALVEYTKYAEIIPVINQLIVQGLENEERILVLTDRSSFAQKLFSELPINQKVLLPENWKTDAATLSILKSSIAKAQISEKSNSKSYLLQKQKTNRSLQQINQYAQAYSSPTFGNKKWVDLVGLYLKHQSNTDKSILSAQLNSTNFEFSYSEYQKLSEKLHNLWPIYSNVGTQHNAFLSYQVEWFTKSGKHQTKKQFIQFGNRIKEQTANIQKQLQQLINVYSETYRDKLDQTYINLSKKLKTTTALLQDYSTVYGNTFKEQKLKTSSINPFLSKQTKTLLKQLKKLERHYISLKEYLNDNSFYEFTLPDYTVLKTIKDYENQINTLNNHLENWRTNSFNQIQDEIKRFSKKHHLNDQRINELIPKVEQMIQSYFTDLKSLNFFCEAPKDYLLTYSKRLKQFNQLAGENDLFFNLMENYEALYDWTRAWHLSSSKEQELFQALIESKSDNWESAFNSWFLNKVIERNLNDEKSLENSEAETAFAQIFKFYPQLLEEISKIWFNKLSKSFYSLSKKDKKKLEKQFELNKSSTDIADQQFTALFQEAFPLCYSSNLSHWTNEDQQLEFDRVIVVELGKVSSSLIPSICNRSNSIIMFSNMSLNNPESIAYYLDQMPLVRKIRLQGKYYNTYIKLSHQAPFIQNRSFSRKIDLHCTQGTFDVSQQINEKEADTIIHLLNTIEIDKQSRIYTKTGILCFSEAQRNLLWSFVRELGKRQDETGEKVRQLERNGLQIGCLDDLLGMDFERLIISATFSYLDNNVLFVNPFEYTEPTSYILGLNWCKYNKAKHIDLVYSSYPEDCSRELSHNPGALLLVNFISAFKEMKANISLGGSYYFKDFDEQVDYTNPLALKLQEELRQYYPINQLRLDYELLGIEFPLAILPEDLKEKPDVIVFDRIISSESNTSLLWDHFFLKKLSEENFNVIHINTIDFWKKPKQSMNILLDQLKRKKVDVVLNDSDAQA